MAITVNTNIQSLICQRSLTKATVGMNAALLRMSTGLRINSAKDDAAGATIASKIDTKLSSYAVAQDNAQMGLSMIDTASGALSVMTNMLQRMRDLSEQAANGTYGTEERRAMQAEVDALKSELYRIKSSTEFNGKKIFGEEKEISGEETVRRITEAEAISLGYTVVKTAQELKAAFYNDDGTQKLNAKVMQFADINLNDLGLTDGSNWTPIGKSGPNLQFKGTFDGNGYTIKNLTINKINDSDQGFFGTTYGSTIQNVNLENVDIKGYNYIGALSGCTYSSTFKNCSVINAKIEAKTLNGGLCGGIFTDSTIENCEIKNINMTGQTYNSCGNLVGFNYGTISNCSATGINYNERTAGFAGLNGNGTTYTGIINNCYSSIESTFPNGGFVNSTNTASETNNCFWDSEISPNSPTNRDPSQYGTPSTTTQMKTAQTYRDAGWDEEIWYLKDGEYPKLIKFVQEDTNSVNPVNLQVGINSDSDSIISIDTGFNLGSFNISLATETLARKSIDKIDKLIEKITAKSLEYGATSNRLESTMEFQAVQINALTNSVSVIKDADIAKESAKYIKNQILQQTTATLLATANQNPNIALNLI